MRRSETSRDNDRSSSTRSGTVARSSLEGIATVVGSDGERTRADLSAEIDRAVRKLESFIDAKLAPLAKNVDLIEKGIKEIRSATDNPQWLSHER